jgi:hypothetical protein
MKPYPRSGVRSAGLLAGLTLVAAACAGGTGSSPTGHPAADQSTPPSASLQVPVSTRTASLDDSPYEPVVPVAATPTSGATRSAATSPAGSQVTETDNGQSVTVQVGSDVALVLHNTYWQVQESSDPAILAAVGDPTYSAGTLSCIPGTGCGMVTAVFHAIAPGKATLTASRTTCGEVLACTGTDGTYQVTIVVEP